MEIDATEEQNILDELIKEDLKSERVVVSESSNSNPLINNDQEISEESELLEGFDIVNGTEVEESEVLAETEVEESEDIQDSHNSDNADAEEPKIKLLQLPLSRVKHIIKIDPEVQLVNQEASFLVTKATELFIDSLAKEAYKYTFQSKKKTIQKKDIIAAIDNVDALLFLDDML